MRGDGRKFQRKSIWWIAYFHRGKEIRESLNSEFAKRLNLDPYNEKDAEKLLKRRRNELVADKLGGNPFVGPKQERITINELIDSLVEDYKIRGKETGDFKSHLKPVRLAFGDMRAVDCTEETTDRVISQWLSEDRSPGTINRETCLLGQAFRFALARKKLSSIPKVRTLPLNNNRKGFFERPEFESLVKNLPEDLRDFTRFAFLTGWRKGEIASLLWEDVDLPGKIIRLRGENSKSGEPRRVALEGDLLEIIKRRLVVKNVISDTGVKSNPLVFHRKGLPVKDIRKAWAAACKSAKVKGKRFHDLRRTAVRNMVRAGIPDSVSMKISGHKTRSVFDRYDITSEDDIRQASKRVESYVKSLPTEREHGQNTDNLT